MMEKQDLKLEKSVCWIRCSKCKEPIIKGEKFLSLNEWISYKNEEQSGSYSWDYTDYTHYSKEIKICLVCLSKLKINIPDKEVRKLKKDRKQRKMARTIRNL